MSDTPQERPILWPAIFIGAFALGGILWLAWMTKAVLNTRAQHDPSFVVLINTNPLPTTAAPPSTNHP